MLVLPAYAKVNLTLDVLGRRPDGWHELDSVAVTIDWHDLVALGPAPELRLRVAGAFAAEVPGGEGNLAHRAALAATGLGVGGLGVWLEKRLPVAAGLGGGSADAAAVLRGAWALARNVAARGRSFVGDDANGGPSTGSAVGGKAGLDRVMELAATLGADVRALLVGGAVRMRGRGDEVETLSAPRLHLAIAVAGRSSTPAAYAAWRSSDRRLDGRPERVARALQRGDRPHDDDLGSALEPAAVRAHPELGRALARLRSATPEHRWHLTGSGGAAFALARDAADARRLAEVAAAAGFVARPCRTLPLPLLEPR